MPISNEEAARIAHLARLRLSPEKIEQFSEELTVVLAYVGKLQEVNTDDVDLSSRGAPEVSVLREDEVSPSLPRDQALANAPVQDGEFFHVPRVIGG